MPVPGTGYKVRVTVVGMTKGKCTQGFKAGDTWLIDKNITPTHFCMNAFCQSVYPAVRGFRYGSEYPWDKDKDVTTVLCPDHTHQVIFEVRRLRE